MAKPMSYQTYAEAWVKHEQLLQKAAYAESQLRHAQAERAGAPPDAPNLAELEKAVAKREAELGEARTAVAALELEQAKIDPNQAAALENRLPPDQWGQRQRTEVMKGLEENDPVPRTMGEKFTDAAKPVVEKVMEAASSLREKVIEAGETVVGVTKAAPKDEKVIVEAISAYSHIHPPFAGTAIGEGIKDLIEHAPTHYAYVKAVVGHTIDQHFNGAPDTIDRSNPPPIVDKEGAGSGPATRQDPPVTIEAEKANAALQALEAKQAVEREAMVAQLQKAMEALEKRIGDGEVKNPEKAREQSEHIAKEIIEQLEKKQAREREFDLTREPVKPRDDR